MRRYLEGIAAVSDPNLFHSGLIFSTERSDNQFPDLLQRLAEARWSLFEVPMRRSISLAHDLRCLVQIRRIVKEFRPDVVNCHSSKAGALGRLAVNSLAKRPAVVFTPNAMALHLGGSFRIIEWILGHGLTDLLIAVGESEEQEIIQSRVVLPDHVFKVPPFIDTEWFSPIDRSLARCQLGLDTAVPLVVGIGRLSEQKDPLTFAAIVAEARRSIPELTALWVGGGELHETLEATVTRLHLEEALTVTGWRDDVRPYLASANVVLMTSLYEGLPHAMAETLAMAKPMVATRVTGTVDLVANGRFGRLFEPGDVAGGAAELVTLLRSPEEGEKMGLAGRAHVEETFGKPQMTANLLDAYALALQRAGRRPRGPVGRAG